jgi:hypothetical protein
MGQKIVLDWDPTFNLQMSCDLKLPVEANVKLEMLSAFSVLYNKYELFAQWYNNPEVPGKDKDSYNMHNVNAALGLNYVYGFLKICGCTDEEIKEFTEIPF